MRQLIIIFLLAVTAYVAYSQENTETSPSNSVKKVTIYEQDYDKGKADGGPAISSVTIYDQKGNIIEETHYKAGKIDETIVYEYDANGQKIKETFKNSQGKISKVSEFKYLDGLKVEKVTYDENHVIKSKKTYQYEKF
jgi:hypothetical protein